MIDGEHFLISNDNGRTLICDADEYERRAIELENQVGANEPYSDSDTSIDAEDTDEQDWQWSLATMDTYVISHTYAFRQHLQSARLRVLTDFEGVTRVPIPENAAMAVYDPIYGSYWMSAMANELEMKSRTSYPFLCRVAVPEQHLVMHGSWIFSTKADEF